MRTAIIIHLRLIIRITSSLVTNKMSFGEYEMSLSLSLSKFNVVTAS